MRRHPWFCFCLLGPLLLAVLPLPATPGDTCAEVPYFRAEVLPGFVHHSGARGKRYIVETMGSGLAWIDFDDDGDLDLFLIDGGPLDAKEREKAPPRSRLLANRGDGTFEDRTEGSGLALSSYGMGCAVGDVDGDGDRDLFVSCFGPDHLFLNEGGLRFRDATATSGLGDPGWGASAALADLDHDGDLDLYLTRYLDFTLENHRECSLGRGIPSYCSPSAYGGVTDLLYRNRGDGTFEEVGVAAGIAGRAGRGLGVWVGDLNGDLQLDVYVANDGEENALFLGRGDLTFVDHTLASGAGYNEDGAAEAGMGIASGDVDGDGHLDLLVTHLSSETHTLYFGEGAGYFRDGTSGAGLAGPTLAVTGFGAAFEDFDCDGRLDLVVANGHVIDNISEFSDLITYAQPDDFFRGEPGRLRKPGRWLQTDPSVEPGVGRGLAVGDADGDGALDWVVSQCDGPPILYRGFPPSLNHWLTVRLRAPGGRSVVGARVTVRRGEASWSRSAFAGGSYLTASESDLRFGLGPSSEPVRLEIIWPDGFEETISEVPVDRLFERTRAAAPHSPEEVPVIRSSLLLLLVTAAAPLPVTVLAPLVVAPFGGDEVNDRLERARQALSLGAIDDAIAQLVGPVDETPESFIPLLLEAFRRGQRFEEGRRWIEALDPAADAPTPILLAVAQWEAEEGWVRRASQRLERGLSARPKDGDLWAGRARLASTAGEPEVAWRAAIQAIEHGTDASELAWLRGEAALEIGFREEGIALLEELLRSTPGHIAARVTLARCARADGDQARAIELLWSALELAPDHAAALGELGSLLVRTESTRIQGTRLLERFREIRDRRERIDRLIRERREGRDTAALRAELARRLREDGRPAIALSIARTDASEAEPSVRATLAAEAGRALRALGKSRLALRELGTALLSDPSRDDVRLDVAEIFLELGDLRRAAAVIDRCGVGVDPRRRELVAIEFAARSGAAWEDVGVRLLELLRQDFDDPETARSLVDAAIGLGQVSATLASLEEWIAEHPESWTAHLALAWLLSETAPADARLPELETLLARGSRLDAWLWIAERRAARGDTEGAEKARREARRARAVSGPRSAASAEVPNSANES